MRHKIIYFNGLWKNAQCGPIPKKLSIIGRMNIRDKGFTCYFTDTRSNPRNWLTMAVTVEGQGREVIHTPRTFRMTALLPRESP